LKHLPLDCATVTLEEGLSVWLALVGTVVLFFFIFPQYQLHRVMVLSKAEKIRTFSQHIESALDNAIKDPTAEQIEYIKDLLELKDMLQKIPEWPFDTKSLVGVISTTLLPILLTIVQRALA
jgi:hypothetical protein